MRTDTKDPVSDCLKLRLPAKLVRLFRSTLSLAALLCAGSPMAFADAVAPVAWDCWIGEEDPISIDCIPHRDLRRPPIPSGQDEEAEAVLLEVIHQRVMSHQTAGLEAFVKAHAKDLRNSVLHAIPIWNYPDESSWVKGLPVQLVRAVLCPSDTVCIITLDKSPR